MIKRLEKLREKLNADAGIIISDPKNALYLTGVHSSNITLYITKEKAYLITDFRYKEIAVKNKPGFFVLFEGGMMENLLKIADKPNILIESNYVTYQYYNQLRESFPRVHFSSAENLLSDLRVIKDENELYNIKQACETSENAYLQTLKDIKDGMSEIELKALLEYNMKLKPSFDTIVLFGENTSCPHGVPSARKLKYGDVILIDFGCFYEGYASDITRTVFFGSVSDEAKKGYQSVLHAHHTALDFIYDNKKCADIDLKARKYLDDCGYAGLFGHSLGHGVGLDIHEAPMLTKKSDTVLQENMTFTIEPGIYIENSFGIRIENTYTIKDGVPVSLVNIDKTLTIL